MGGSVAVDEHGSPATPRRGGPGRRRIVAGGGGGFWQVVEGGGGMSLGGKGSGAGGWRVVWLWMGWGDLVCMSGRLGLSWRAGFTAWTRKRLEWE